MPFPAVAALIGPAISGLSSLFSGPSPEELQKIHDDAVARHAEVSASEIQRRQADRSIDNMLAAANNAAYKGTGSVSDRGGADSFKKNEEFAKNDILGSVATAVGGNSTIIMIVIAVVAFFFITKK